MKAPRFRIEVLCSEPVLLSKEESRHALSVLRLKAGDAVELFDGKGAAFSGTVLGEAGGRLRVQPNAPSPVRETMPVRITLAPAIVKSDAMDLLIQKAAELGAAEIAPLVTERTVVRISADRREGKLERWQKIAAEACKQCGRSDYPTVRPVARYDDFVRNFSEYDMILLPTLVAKGRGLYETMKDSAAKRVLVLIGPEGDFSPTEAAEAVSRGARPVSLGPLVLRSETAALYALSTIAFFFREVRA